MPKTTADVPPDAASEFAKARRPSAIADATGSPGYTTTKTMQKGMQPGKGSKQFGLPKSPPKGGPGVVLHVRVVDTDKDKM
jgi:hypothetical protein